MVCDWLVMPFGFLVGLKLEAKTKIRILSVMNQVLVSLDPFFWGDWLPGLVARNDGLTRSLTSSEEPAGFLDSYCR